MITITIPKKIEKELKAASRHLGLAWEDFSTSAILYYLQILEKKIELKREIEAWDKTSDSDLIKFENSI